MSRWNSFRSLPKAPRHLCVCGLLLLACSQPVAPERPAMPSLEALIAHAKGQATPVKSTGEPVRPKNWQEEGYCAGQTLVLDDLTGLHGVEAGALSTYEGRCLHLNGLKRLDADIATLLSGFGAHHKGSEWGGAVLSLNGITTLDPTTAAALAKQTADVLLFNGLTELDVATATALAAFQGTGLELNGLTELDVTTANALAAFQVGRLQLNGLTHIQADVANALVQYGAASFERRNQRIRDTGSAYPFPAPELSLHGLAKLDPATAKALAQWPGYELDLRGLTTLDPASATALVGFQGLPYSVGRAECLGFSVRATASRRPCPANLDGAALYLDGLVRLDLETAKVLATFGRGPNNVGTLGLDGLATLDLDTAKALAAFEGGRLNLRGLAKLDAATAKVLAQWLPRSPSPISHQFGVGHGEVDKRGSGYDTPVGLGSEYSDLFGDPVILGALNVHHIFEVVQTHESAIRACYTSKRASHPTLGGKTVVKMFIAKDGTVSSATTKASTLQNPAVDDCVVRQFKEMTFPKPNGDGIAIVGFPVLFQPAGLGAP